MSSISAVKQQKNLKITLDDLDINGLKQLLKIGLEAIKIKPPMLVRSILGNPSAWVLTRNNSEFTAVNIYRPLQTLEYAIDLAVPALPVKAPAPLPPLVKRLFWRPTRMLFNPDQNQNPNTFPAEDWFFINGICTNETVARMNADYLAELFHRPIQMVQNATDGVVVDLAECVVGKGLALMTEPARKAYPAILTALQNPDKKRVVVVCHSQGTIIMANILRALQDPEFKKKLFAEVNQVATETDYQEPEPLFDTSLLAKLEIYAFANCATQMKMCEGKKYPYIESYGNQYDIVARLGCLSPEQQALDIDIDGTTFEKTGMWGHLLNAHYLFGIHDYLVAGGKNPYQARSGSGTELPRLYSYFHGGKPKPSQGKLSIVKND